MEVPNRITPHFNQYFGVIDLIILLNFFQTHRCMLMPEFFSLQIEQKDIAVNCQLRMLSAPCLVRISYVCTYVSSKPSQKVCKHLQKEEEEEEEEDLFEGLDCLVLPQKLMPSAVGGTKGAMLFKSDSIVDNFAKK
jgi:hypothetical protein